MYEYTLDFQKLKSMVHIFAADNIGLCLLLFTQLSLKVETSEAKRTGMKTEFDMK